MTKRIKTPDDIEKTHASSVSVDQLANELANRCVVEGITPLKSLTTKAQEAMNEDDWQIYLSGSSFTAAAANPLHFLANKFVKVFYGLNANLILGSAYHKGLQVANDYYIENEGKWPRFGLCLKASFDYINENFSKIKEDEDVSKDELFTSVLKMLRVYWQEQLEDNNPVESEVFVSMPAPEYMLRNVDNAKKIFLTGAADVVYDTKKGLVLSDHKSSKKPIKGKAEKSENLIKLEEELEEFRKELGAAEKQIKKFANSETKLAEAKASLSDIAHKLGDARSNGKATTALEKRLKKYEDEVVKWKEHLAFYEETCKNKEDIENDIFGLNELMAPLQEEHKEAQMEADLKAAKKAHGQQLAFYALLYMIINGRDIKRVRVEVMIKAKEPYLQMFEWELDDMVLAKAEEQIRANILKIELMLEGIDPLALFPMNTMTFIGLETNKLVDDIEEIAELLREKVNGE